MCKTIYVFMLSILHPEIGNTLSGKNAHQQIYDFGHSLYGIVNLGPTALTSIFCTGNQQTLALLQRIVNLQ